MTTGEPNPPERLREEKVRQTAARREVLVVCSDRILRSEYAGIFERRKLRTLRAASCRVATKVIRNHDLRMAIIQGDPTDRDVGTLISLLKARCPQAVVWLIGNPPALHVSVNAMDHQVVVLPPATTPCSLERIALPERARSATAAKAKHKHLLRRREVRKLERVEKYARAKAEFERQFLTRALERCEGNISLTAKAVGIARRNLQWKIRALRIDIESTRVKVPGNAAIG